MTEEKAQPQENKIQIQDRIPGSEYANAMQVSHTKEEFLLNFLNKART